MNNEYKPIDYLALINKYSLPNKSHGIDKATIESLYGFVSFITAKDSPLTVLDLGTNVGNSLTTLVAGIYNALIYTQLPIALELMPKIVTVDNGKYATFNLEKTTLLISELKAITNFDIELVIDDDIRYLESLPDEVANVIFIDSDHTYGHVSKLLDLATLKTKLRGLICGHDYSYGAYEVLMAVDEWRLREIPNKKITGMAIEKSFWWNVRL